MPTDSSASETAPHGCAECIGLVHAAQDSGDWRPVAVWLAGHPECAGTFARFMDADARTRRQLPAARSFSDLPGTRLGDVVIQKEIGRGTFGVVFRGYDSLNRDVAVKLLLNGDPDRFRIEAETVAGLRHENIVPVFTFGETDGGPYLVMPLMAGTLGACRAAAPGGKLHANEAARLVRDIARGAHHAHQHGLIHRDLKPANVLLEANGAPRIADFGLARRVDVTASVGIAGTFAYMAPEQAESGKQLTTAVDVHALGAILFELLTGRVPYSGDVASVLRKLTDPNEQAPAVSSLLPDVPADLEVICQKCLERAPSDRYGSANELADELTCFLEGKPIKARPRGLYETARQMLVRPPEVQTFVTLPGVVFAAVHHPVVHFAIMGLVLAGEPGWAFGVMMYHLASWFGQTLWFNVRRLGRLNSSEQKAALFGLGNWLAVAALVPLHLTFFGTDVMPLYPLLNVATGLGFFLLAVLFAARHSFIGLLILAQNLVLPFVPMWAWPLLHAVTGMVPFTLFGLHLWSVHRAANV